MLLRFALICALSTLAEAQVPFPPEPTLEPTVHKGSFLVVAPSVVRPGLPFAVSVSLLDMRDELIVRVEIRDSRNQTIANKIETGVKQGAPRTVRIDSVSADSLLPGAQYKVYVRGESISGQTLFEAEESVRFDAKSLSVFVQTDKAIYKPGALVHLRAVVVNPDLKPYSGAVDITISDPNQNVIKQWKELQLATGVASQDLTLSDEPPLGDWKITVETDNGVEFEKTFSVDKYILPKFEVTVKPPPFVTIRDDVAVTVKATYTYGKGVDGTVTLVAKQPWRWYGPDGEQAPIQKTARLDDGEAVVRFTNAELKDKSLINEYGQNTILFVATVTEALTDIQRNGSGQLVAYREAVKVELNKGTETFKPGLVYKMVVAVKGQDDSPLKSSLPRRIQLKTRYSFPYTYERRIPLLPSIELPINIGPPIIVDEEGAPVNATAAAPPPPPPEPMTLPPPPPPPPTPKPPLEETRVVNLDEDGSLVLELSAPINASSLFVEVRYDMQGEDNFDEAPVYQTQHVDASKSPTSSFLQLTASQGSVAAGETISFDLRSTHTLDSVSVQVVARGSTVLSEVVTMAADAATVSFLTTSEMAPKARLVVYAVRDDNKEILVDATDFQVSGLFQNEVSVSMDREDAQPDEKVTITVRAEPDSFVGLLAVDQSVLLLKSGNDITTELVEADIAQYDTTNQGGYGPFYRGWEGPFMERRRKRSIWYPWWGIGGKDAETVFRNAGLVVLTDAWLFSEPQPQMPPVLLAAPAAFGGVEMAAERMPMNKQVLQQAAPPTTASLASPPVRSEFPEAWICAPLTARQDGSVTYEADVPDTITSWIASAFAVHDDAGLGIAPTTAKLQVFKPFFVRLNLPYSVKRGEALALQVLIFNYMDSAEPVTVTLDFNDKSGFDFVEQNLKPIKLNKVDKSLKEYNVRRVTVPGGGASRAVYFPIMPNKVGEVLLLVRASASAARDAVEMPLLVKPEGYRVERNKPVVVDLSEETSFTTTVSMDFPADVVADSQGAKIEIIGDIMGPVLNDVENLIQMPYGCGEQNMLGFVPNIVVMRYLQATQRLTADLENKATKYMEAGYQRELNYKRDDHSFSAFGQSDAHGSTWLTAFVVRSFKQAEAYIFVDPEILRLSIGYLESRQLENGAFEEIGEVHHTSMQGGASEGGVPMTAYVLITLLESGVINRDAVAYVEKALASVADEPYTLALAAYALQLANSNRKDEALEMLVNLKRTEDSTTYWSDAIETAEENFYYYGPTTVDVETTSYALLTYMERGDTSAGLPIVRWLTNQRNPYGGFGSTQDTVVGLQSLGAYAEAAYSPEFDVSIDASVGGAVAYSATVNPDNAIVLRSYEVDRAALSQPIRIDATGSGVVFVQVSWHYHLTKLRADEPFICNQTVLQERSSSVVLSMCCHYNKEGKSNMALLEVDALSGFGFDSDQLSSMTSRAAVQRVETEKDGTKANFYFSSLSATPVCVDLTSEMQYKVAEQKPAQMALRDYYVPENEIKSVYSAKQTVSTQQFCDDASCWAADVSDEPTQAGSRRSAAWAPWLPLLALLAALVPW